MCLNRRITIYVETALIRTQPFIVKDAYSASIHFPHRGLLNKMVKEINSRKINDGSHQHWHRPLKRKTGENHS